MNRNALLLLIGIAVLAGAGGIAYMSARGIRNNNPGNIRRTATRWRGMAPDQSGDAEYIIFLSPEYGIRAMTRILRNYESRHGLRTIEQIISRWAPPSENVTSSYIEHVSRKLNVPPGQPLPGGVNAFMPELIEVIIQHENGSQPYTREQILRGISLA